MTCQPIRLWIAVKTLNYTNHSSSTLEMGTEAFLDNRDLGACDLSPATSAAHSHIPHVPALPRASARPTATATALSHHCRLFSSDRHSRPCVETVLYSGGLSSWGRFLPVLREVKAGEKEGCPDRTRVNPTSGSGCSPLALLQRLDLLGLRGRARPFPLRSP